MANVTEKDIIQHLKERIKLHENEAGQHQKEAKRLSDLLTAFMHEPASDSKSKSAKLKPGKKPEAKATKITDAIAEQIGEATPAKTAEPLNVPEKYSDNLTLNAKIAFALNEIGSGFNEDIASAMAQYEPKSDATKISKQISGVLSSLKSKGQLSAEKVGRKDKFSLVK